MLPPWWRDRAFVLVVAAALLVKAAVLVQLGGHPLLQPLGELDTALYVQLARAMAEGGPLAVDQPFFVSPLYTYFLAAVFAAGGSIGTARAAQVALGALAVGLVYRTTCRWFGPAAGVIAAMLAIGTGLFTFYEILILQAALDPCLVAAMLASLARADRPGGAASLAAAGAWAGLFALNRPNGLAYAAVAGVWLAVQAWRSREAAAPRAALVRAAAFPLALTAILGANGARNYAASGEWVAIASHGGLNFYIGNNAEADGFYTRVPGVTPSVAGQTGDTRRVAEAALGRPLTAAEVSDYFLAQAFDWIAAHPGDAARLLAWKLALLVNRENVPLNFSYAYYSRDEPSLLQALVVGPWLLLPLGLAGLLVRPSGRAAATYALWAAFAPIYGLSVAVFFIASRYRMPMLVPLCGSAAALLVWAADRVRDGDRRRLAAAAGLVGALGLLVNWPLGLDDGRGWEQTRRAVWLVQEGRGVEAGEYVARVEPGHPYPAVLHLRVGRAFAAANRFEEAADHFRRSLAADPGQAEALLELGQALTVAGQPEEAARVLRDALDRGHRPDLAAPWLVRALAASGDRDGAVAVLANLPTAALDGRPGRALDLGVMALELSAPWAGVRWLRAAVEAEPDHPEAHEMLGVALLLENDLAGATGSLETARRLAPARASVRLNLAVVYARAGRLEDARAEAIEARRLDPNEPRAAALLRDLDAGRRP
ncbi:MAG: tetratricopeptide repeat protein [Acidobacteriota bacterium]